MKKIFFLFVFLALILVILNHEKNISIEKHLLTKSKEHKQNYENIYLDHKRLADTIFKLMVNTPETLYIFKEANLDKNIIRDRLYKKLHTTYELLKNQNLKQLSFYLPNNECLLSYHKPKHFGYKIKGLDQIISYVNKHKVPVDCFERRDDFDAYGFIYPLFYEGRYLGSVEILLDSAVISEEFTKRYNLDSSFLSDELISKEIKESIFEDGAISIYDKEIEKILTFIKIDNSITKVIDIFSVQSDPSYILYENQKFYILVSMAFVLFASSFYLKFYRLNMQKKMSQVIVDLEEKEDILSQKSKMAAMGEMMDSIAHQWIQPISIIRMRIQTMQMDYLFQKTIDKNLEENMEGVINQVNHLMNTLDEFRSFFKPSKKIETIKLYSLINSSLNLMEDELKQNVINIDIQGDKTLDIKVNPSEFKHVIINIVNNAKDAFIQNDIEQRDICFHLKKVRSKVLLEISDNAGGIPKSIIKKVFDPYFTTKKDEGTGIGLYMTKQIVEKYNGNISIQKLNDGTCFSIKI